MGNEPKQAEDRQLRAGATTYFFDIDKTKNEQVPYLKITASRFQGEDKPKDQKYQKQSIVVFREHAKDFSEIVSEMLQKLQ